ncbi:hypothetical protein CU098_012048, partial [Rhizopus stolonifer]
DEEKRLSGQRKRVQRTSTCTSEETLGDRRRVCRSNLLYPQTEEPERQVLAQFARKGVVELTPRKTKAVQKKNYGTKKRKRDNGKASKVDVNARVSTGSEYFVDFLSSLMDALDQCKMQGRYLVMHHSAIHKVNESQELIAS